MTRAGTRRSAGTIERRTAGLRQHADVIALLMLTFSTGVVDAVGFLGLDRVFTGNMTGNVVIMGMAMTGSTGLPVLGPTVALAGFMVGAVVGGRVLRTTASAWTRRTVVVLLTVAMVLAACALGALVVEDLTAPGQVTVAALLASAMGAQAAAARHVGVKDVTTVVVTSTITGLAADSRLGGNTRGGLTGRRSAAVVLIILGAATGAALLQVDLAAGLAVAVAVTAVATTTGAIWANRAAPE